MFLLWLLECFCDVFEGRHISPQNIEIYVVSNVPFRIPDRGTSYFYFVNREACFVIICFSKTRIRSEQMEEMKL